MRTPSTEAEVRERVSATLKHVSRIGKIAVLDPDMAIREAEGIDDSQMRVSALISVSRQSGKIEPLVDARDVLLGIPDLSDFTRNDRLAKIAFYSAGVDNSFAADTAREATGTKMRRQLHQQLSVLMTGSIKTKLGNGEHQELTNYPEFVVAAFHESTGDSTYFGEDDATYTYIKAPTALLQQSYDHTLDPFSDGLRAMEVLRNNEPYFLEMAAIVVSHR